LKAIAWIQIKLSNPKLQEVDDLSIKKNKQHARGSNLRLPALRSRGMNALKDNKQFEDRIECALVRGENPFTASSLANLEEDAPKRVLGIVLLVVLGTNLHS
jgi:hypothetical protein